MKQCIDIYTGTYVDNKDKQVKGVAFAAICKGKKGSYTHTNTDPEQTSAMEMWMSEMDTILKRIPADTTQFEECALIIHSWSHNLKKITSKMQSIYNQLKEYDEDMWDVVAIKLRRANGTKYPYHDQMASIMLTLLRYNKMLPLDVKFVSTSPKNAAMGLAYQRAEVALKPA